MSFNVLREIHPDLTSNIHSGKPFYILTVSQRQPHLHLSQHWPRHARTSHMQHLRSPSRQSFGWWLTCAFAMPTKQVPAKDLEAQPDFPSKSCPRQSRVPVFPGEPLVLLLSNSCCENHAIMSILFTGSSYLSWKKTKQIIERPGVRKSSLLRLKFGSRVGFPIPWW